MTTRALTRQAPQPAPRSAPAVAPAVSAAAAATAAARPAPAPAEPFVHGARPPQVSTVPSMVKLFEGIALGTKWKDLPHETQVQLGQVVKEMTHSFDAKWNAQALRAKQTVLHDAPDRTMVEGFNRFVATVFEAFVPVGFKAQHDLKNETVRNAMKDLVLTRAALAGTLNQYYGGTNTDWDGRLAHDFPVPSAASTAAAQALAEKTLARLEKVKPDQLTEVEQALLPRLKMKLTSVATGSFGSSFGGREMLRPTRGSWGSDLQMQLKANKKPEYHGRSEEFLRVATAFWLTPLTEGVNKGTIEAAHASNDMNNGPDTVKELLGDPATDEVAKAFSLLLQWHTEALDAHPDAHKLGYHFDQKQIDTMWRSFQADSMAGENAQTLPEFKASMDAQVAAATLTHKQETKDLVDAVFSQKGAPRLTAAQKQQVFAQIDAQPTFGTLASTLGAALDAATGTTKASEALQQALDAMPTVGGLDKGAPIPADVQQLVDDAWKEIKAYLGKTYHGSVDLAATLPEKVRLSTTEGSSTDLKGDIVIDLRPEQKLSELISMLKHEGKHSVDMQSDKRNAVEGTAWEGAARVAEQRVVPKFLAQKYAHDPVMAAVAKFSLINTDVRLAARTEATLVTLMTPNGHDAYHAAVKVGQKWGADVPSLIARAFNGTQYTQYMGGQIAYNALLDYLGAGLDFQLDPFWLQAHGLEDVAMNEHSRQRVLDAAKQH
ncbi:MAG: hypothetical protein IPJ65_22730 [Archangiaceae bacterium]|nr:hypothetical protein [Archangiaceae bacterium]